MGTSYGFPSHGRGAPDLVLMLSESIAVYSSLHLRQRTFPPEASTDRRSLAAQYVPVPLLPHTEKQEPMLFVAAALQDEDCAIV